MADFEKPHGASDNYSPTGSEQIQYGHQTEQPRTWTGRFVDSFKRDPNAHATPSGAVGADGKVYDVESAAANTANSPLSRSLKGRHLQMIAIGGSIGTGMSSPSDTSQQNTIN